MRLLRRFAPRNDRQIGKRSTYFHIRTQELSIIHSQLSIIISIFTGIFLEFKVKKVLLFLSITLMFASLMSCSSNEEETLGGFQKLKWGSDIPSVKSYLEKDINANYDYYEMNSTSGVLSLRFTGSSFDKIPVKNWTFNILKGGLIGYEIEFADSASTEQNFTKLLSFIKTKLGEPDNKSESRASWNRVNSEKKFKEKISLRKFENGITLKIEKTNG
jgi:hypothetical protein